MKSILPAIAIATGGLLGLASFGAEAADGTITFTGSVSNTTCSINGVASGSPADVTVPLKEVTASSLAAAGATGCTGAATKAVANFENGPTVDQTTGNLTNTTGSAKNVQVQLLNAQRQPINVVTSLNNDIATNGADINAGSGNLQYYSTGGAQPGSVNTSVQYTMQYQ
ncbi:Pilin (type 1 fimbria component protein) [Burkholderia sp. OK233]|nr:Pilin (type 1 fimbria component protein) [Burkholderia sp. OK233]